MADRDRPRVGRFVIEGELGRGQWGEVLAARDPRLDRRVALKRIPPDLAADPLRREHFESEARLLAAVNHPNVATLFGLEDDDEGAPHLVMELVPGATLAERLLEGALAASEALDVGCQLAAGIEAAHAAGVVHGDLKPANVKLTPVGRVKVLDFGIARRHRAPAEAPMDSSSPPKGGVSGSPGYMGPEQLAGVAADERTDCWSFGCVLFECLAGARAFPGETLSEVLTATAHGEPDWSALPDGTAEELRTLLRACLSRELGDRPSSLGAVREQLERLSAAARENSPAVSPTVRRLPAPTTSFVGRESELQDLEQLLEEARLVTLTGVGGSGKSRLVLEFARRLEKKGEPVVHLVELAALSDGRLVDSQVLGALGLKERPGASPRDVLVEALAKGRHLLVLDNCEHLLPACSSLCSELLASCPELKIVTTSREGLGLPGEHALVVPPLATALDEATPTAASLGEVESVRLFLDRARAVRRGFELTDGNAAAVASIVRRLDGLPLGLELAAARLRALSVAQLDERLSESYRVLSRSQSCLPRHRTMQAAIDWSHDLLTTRERVLYRRLSVFSGGWSVELAERVCAGDGLDAPEVLDLLAHLVDKSLVLLEDRNRQPRYRFLDPLLQHARMKLADSGESDIVRVRHLHGLTEIVEAWKQEWPYSCDPRRMPLLEKERGNLRAALRFCEGRNELSLLALRLASTTWSWWQQYGRLDEGRRTLDAVLAMPDEGAESYSRARLLCGASILADNQGDRSAAAGHAERAVTIVRDLGDDTGLASSLFLLARLQVQTKAGSCRRLALLNEALTAARRAHDEGLIANVRYELGRFELEVNSTSAAREHLEAALERWREMAIIGNVGETLSSLADVELQDGRPEAAAPLIAEAVALERRDGGLAGRLAAHLLTAGRCAQAMDDDERAEACWLEASQIGREFGYSGFLASALMNLGDHAGLRQGDWSRARSLHEEAVAVLRSLTDAKNLRLGLRALALSSFGQGRLAQARELRRQALEVERRDALPMAEAPWLVQLAQVLTTRGKGALAGRLLGAADAIMEAYPLVRGAGVPGADLRVRTELRSLLGDAEYESSLAAGRELTPEQAAELVLGRDEDTASPSDLDGARTR